MSETINARESRANIRWQLLTTVSAIALIASVCAGEANAADADRPMLWIELGGQFEQMSGTGDKFTPPFLLVQPTPEPYLHGSPLDAQNAAKFSIGPEAKISFQPDGSDWVFAASARYGRSVSNKHLHHQTSIPYLPNNFGNGPIPKSDAFAHCICDFSDAKGEERERHVIVDFQAGKDVGLGPTGSASVVSAGIRFAQFSTSSQFNVRARTDVQVSNLAHNYPPPIYFATAHYHSNGAAGSSNRNFHGVGPSVSWNASMPVAGSRDAAQIAVDWGLNAALLFGRQRTSEHHQTTSVYYKWRMQTGYPVYHHAPPSQNRIKSVMVSNAGGFAGVSLKFPNAKLSLGYRGDFFFGAIDGGIDAAKKETRGFYGPFATISIGVGG